MYKENKNQEKEAKMGLNQSKGRFATKGKKKESRLMRVPLKWYEEVKKIAFLEGIKMTQVIGDMLKALVKNRTSSCENICVAQKAEKTDLNVDLQADTEITQNN